LHEALVERPCSRIRRLAGGRAQEVRFTRFLRNPSVSAREMARHAAQATAGRVVDRDIVVVQDTSELALGGKRARANGYGPVGKGGGLGGLLLHAALALEAQTGALLGLAHAEIWNRDEGEKVKPRRGRDTADKESQRWLDATAFSGEVLARASRITVVSDRESDIYEHFAQRPQNVELIVRACQNRRIDGGGADGSAYLFAFVDGLPEAGRFLAKIPAAPGRKEREAELAVRFSPVKLRKPQHGASGLPDTVALTLVDVHEVQTPKDSEPIHWRLLTTHAVTSLGEARRIVELYRMRWTIEEFFRTLKTAGFDIENADIGDPEVMINFVAAATVAAVTVMQLVKARDGATDQLLTDAFEAEDRRLLEAVSAKLEGATLRQKNPHPQGSLAFAAWVIARLGGWTGYYGKPGPKVMRQGLDDFQRIKLGVTLGL
jgi:Transposase DDE domain